MSIGIEAYEDFLFKLEQKQWYFFSYGCAHENTHTDVLTVMSAIRKCAFFFVFFCEYCQMSFVSPCVFCAFQEMQIWYYLSFIGKPPNFIRFKSVNYEMRVYFLVFGYFRMAHVPVCVNMSWVMWLSKGVNMILSVIYGKPTFAFALTSIYRCLWQ